MNLWRITSTILLACTVCGCASAPPTAPAPPPPTSAAAGATTIVAIAPPAAPATPPPSIWDFLGIKGLFKLAGGLVDRVRNRLGSRFPGLEATPPLKSITDPANMSADSPPAVKAAAEAKANEDAAPQKIKAIRYLARLGCTDCYPDVEPALIAALEDCTESVRYEAVKTIRALCGGICNSCKSNQCCSEDVVKKLDELANKQDDRGCYVEPSARVRRIARMALECCRGVPSVAPSAESELPTEGPSQALPAPTPPPPPAPSPAPGTSAPTAQFNQAPPRVWAEVNGVPIFDHEVLKQVEVRYAAAMAAGQPLAPQDEPQITREIVDQLVQRKLLYQAAEQLDPNRVALVSYEMHGQPDAESIERRVADSWLKGQVRISEEISREELFHYYRANLDRFQRPAEVRWEQSSAPLQRFRSRQQAEQALELLRAASQGAAIRSADQVPLGLLDVRTYGWTRSEEVPSAAVGEWLAKLPVGQLSPVIGDERALHLVRVLERREAQSIDLEHAAPQIRHEILAARRQRAEQQYVQHLASQARVWTIFDAPPVRTAGQ